MKKAPGKMVKFLEEARALKRANKTSKALQAARHAYAIASEHLPSTHPERVQVVEVLGHLLIDMGERAEGEKMLRNIGVLPATTEAEAEAASRNEESERLLKQLLTQETVQHIHDAFKFASENLPHDSPLLLESAYYVGISHWQFGRLAEAEKSLREVFRLRRLREIDDRFLTTAVYLVDALLASNQHGQVRRVCTETIEVCQKLQQVNPDELANIHAALARVMDPKTDGEDFFSHMLRSAELREQAAGIHDESVGKSWRGVAFHFVNVKRRSEGEDAFAKAFEAYQVALGLEHPETLEVMLMRGMNLIRMGPERARERLEMVRRSNETATATVTPGHPMRVNFAKMLELAETTFAKLGL